MSCECEKLRQLYERFNTDHLEVITQAQNHVYSSAVGNGQDVCESQFIKPSYESSNAVVTNYNTSENSTDYGMFNVISYDTPGFMPAFVQNYTPLSKEVEERNIDPNVERLEEMISRAKEDSKWMSTTQ